MYYTAVTNNYNYNNNYSHYNTLRVLGKTSLDQSNNLYTKINQGRFTKCRYIDKKKYISESFIWEVCWVAPNTLCSDGPRFNRDYDRVCCRSTVNCSKTTVLMSADCPSELVSLLPVIPD